MQEVRTNAIKANAKIRLSPVLLHVLLSKELPASFPKTLPKRITRAVSGFRELPNESKMTRGHERNTATIVAHHMLQSVAAGFFVSEEKYCLFYRKMRNIWFF